MRETYGGDGENRHGGFHNRERKTPNEGHGGHGSSAMSPGGGKHRHMSEPTNHAGHTHEMARRHEHDARVEGHRAVHAGKGQMDHERILHETHKLHQGPFTSHGNKHGESHHIREGESASHERHESKAERAREGE